MDGGDSYRTVSQLVTLEIPEKLFKLLGLEGLRQLFQGLLYPSASLSSSSHSQRLQRSLRETKPGLAQSGNSLASLSSLPRFPHL